MTKIRIHNSTDTHLYVYTTSKLIIEDCSRLAFHEVQYQYPNIQNDIKKSGLQGHNFWKDVQDFKWIKKERSPNFVLVFDGKEQAPEEIVQPVFHNPTHIVPAQVTKIEEPQRPVENASNTPTEETRVIISSDKIELPKSLLKLDNYHTEDQKPEAIKLVQPLVPTKIEPAAATVQDENEDIDEL